MVSLAKSSALLFSFCHSARGLIRTSLKSSSSLTFLTPLHQRRRSFLTTTLVAGACWSASPQKAGSASSSSAPLVSACETSTQRTMTSLSTGYLNAADAAALDAELMSVPGFSLEQLMELAGLSVAEAVYQVLPPSLENKPKILLVCGPGNNGGDGLVAARHLVFFGYECHVYYPKQSTKQHFINLVQQCQDVDVTILVDLPDDLTIYNGIVDAIFGFSFHGEPREPFASALTKIITAQQTNRIPVISVDVPSGWNVDQGDVSGLGFVPDVLVSLTTPKESARFFHGRHFVGGRFLPPKLAKKYNVQMPPYPGTSQVMEVSTDTQGEFSSDNGRQQKESLPGPNSASTSSGWEAEYAAYLRDLELQKQQQQQTGTDDLVPITSSPQNEGNAETDSWERQYAEYCAEKEARLFAEDAKQRQQERKLYEE